jgi:polygalacturonase
MGYIPERRDVYPDRFGAKGDGITDDTAALQAAADYARVNGAKLKIPAGTYLVSAPITFRGPGEIWEGDGLQDTVLQAAGDNSIIASYYADLSLRSQYITLQDMKLEGITGNTTSPLDIRGTSYMVLKRLYIDGKGTLATGINQQKNGSSPNFCGYTVLEDVYSLRCRYGYYGETVNQLEFIRGVYSENQYYGVYLYGCTNVQFRNCEFNGNSRDGDFGVSGAGSWLSLTPYNGTYPDGYYQSGGIRLRNCTAVVGSGLWFEETPNRASGIVSRNDIDTDKDCEQIRFRNCRWGDGMSQIHTERKQLGLDFGIEIAGDEKYIYARDYADIDDALLAAAYEDKTLYFHRGVWQYDQLRLPTNVRLEGAGIGMTILECTKTQTAQAEWTEEEVDAASFIATRNWRDTTSSPREGIQISNIEIVGNKTISASDDEYRWYNGISLMGNNRVHISKCRIRDFAGVGIEIYQGLGSGGENKNVTIEDCEIDSCCYSGVRVITGQNVSIRRNYFTGDGDCGVSTRNLNNGNGWTVNGLRIEDNKFDSVAGDPLNFNDAVPQYVYDAVIKGNHFLNCTGMTGLAKFRGRNWTIKENVFRNCTSSGIFLEISGDTVFADNMFIGCTCGGVFLQVLGNWDTIHSHKMVRSNLFRVTGPDNSVSTNVVIDALGTTDGFDPAWSTNIIENTFQVQGFYAVLSVDRTDAMVRDNIFDTGGADDPAYIVDANTYLTYGDNVVTADLTANFTGVNP